MNFQEALKEVGKHQPCPHDALQTDLGNGKVWARCEDCGQTIRQESIPRLRAEHERFLEAITVLAKAGDSVKRDQLQQILARLDDIQAHLSQNRRI